MSIYTKYLRTIGIILILNLSFLVAQNEDIYVDKFIEMLQSKNETLRERAVTYFKSTSSERVIKKLLNLYQQTTDNQLRLIIINILLKTGNISILPVLEQSIPSADDRLLAKIITAIGTFGNKNYLPKLKLYTNHRSVAVRIAANMSIKRIESMMGESNQEPEVAVPVETKIEKIETPAPEKTEEEKPKKEYFFIGRFGSAATGTYVETIVEKNNKKIKLKINEKTKIIQGRSKKIKPEELVSSIRSRKFAISGFNTGIYIRYYLSNGERIATYIHIPPAGVRGFDFVPKDERIFEMEADLVK